MIRWIVLGLFLLEWLFTSRLLQRKGEQLDRHEHPEYLRKSDYVQGSGTPPGSGGVTDHGELDGLDGDDHSQYHTDARGDARYYTETELDAGQLDSRYYTETELDAGQLDSRYYSETELDAGQLDNRYYRENEHINSSAGAGDAGKPIVLDAGGKIDASMVEDGDVDHGSIGGLADDDHTQYHNDTRGDARYLQQTNNLSDLNNAATARTNLGLGSLATQSATDLDGAGLGESAGELTVNVDDSTIEINADTLRVKDLGITTAKLNALAVTTAKIANDAVDKTKIASDLAGAALSQAAGGELDVQVDGTTIEVSGGALQLVSGVIDSVLPDGFAVYRGSGTFGSSTQILSHISPSEEVWVLHMVWNSSQSVMETSFVLPFGQMSVPGSGTTDNDIYTGTGDTLTLTVDSNGDLFLESSGGSDSFTVNLFVIYI